MGWYIIYPGTNIKLFKILNVAEVGKDFPLNWGTKSKIYKPDICVTF